MKLRAFLCKVSPQYRLRMICRAIGIKPYDWQRKFALCKAGHLDSPPGRATGKTMAVMLRLLLAESEPHECCPLASRYFSLDPDWIPSDRRRCKWYYGEYLRLWHICFDAKVYPFYLHSRYNPFRGRMP